MSGQERVLTEPGESLRAEQFFRDTVAAIKEMSFGGAVHEQIRLIGEATETIDSGNPLHHWYGEGTLTWLAAALDDKYPQGDDDQPSPLVAEYADALKVLRAKMDQAPEGSPQHEQYHRLWGIVGIPDEDRPAPATAPHSQASTERGRSSHTGWRVAGSALLATVTAGSLGVGPAAAATLPAVHNGTQAPPSHSAQPFRHAVAKKISSTTEQNLRPHGITATTPAQRPGEITAPKPASRPAAPKQKSEPSRTETPSRPDGRAPLPASTPLPHASPVLPQQAHTLNASPSAKINPRQASTVMVSPAPKTVHSTESHPSAPQSTEKVRIEPAHAEATITPATESDGDIAPASSGPARITRAANTSDITAEAVQTILVTSSGNPRHAAPAHGNETIPGNVSPVLSRPETSTASSQDPASPAEISGNTGEADSAPNPQLPGAVVTIDVLPSPKPAAPSETPTATVATTPDTKPNTVTSSQSSTPTEQVSPNPDSSTPGNSVPHAVKEHNAAQPAGNTETSLPPSSLSSAATSPASKPVPNDLSQPSSSPTTIETSPSGTTSPEEAAGVSIPDVANNPGATETETPNTLTVSNTQGNPAPESNTQPVTLTVNTDSSSPSSDSSPEASTPPTTITATNTAPQSSGPQAVTQAPATQPKISRQEAQTTGGVESPGTSSSPSTPVPPAQTVSITSTSTPNSPAMPSTPVSTVQQQATEAANTASNIAFTMSNGDTLDALKAQTEGLQSQGYTSTPDSPFKDAINQAINTLNQQINTKAGASTVNKGLMDAGLLVNVQNARSAVNPNNQLASAGQSAYQTEVISQLADTQNGLASLPGAENYDSATLNDIFSGIAAAAASLTSREEQQSELSANTTASVSVSTPSATPPDTTPQATTPTPAPQPQPAASKGQHPEAPKPPELLTSQQQQIEAANQMIAQGGATGREGQVLKYLLQNTNWSVNAITGILGNTGWESDTRPMRLQGHSEDVPYSQLVTMGLEDDSSIGWGLFQATPANKMTQTIKAAGKDPNDILAQTWWIMNALQNNPSDYDLSDLLSSNTPEAAADIFEENFERAGVPALGNRESAARGVYNTFMSYLSGIQKQQQNAQHAYQRALHKYHDALAKAKEQAAAEAQQKAQQMAAAKEKAAEAAANGNLQPAQAPFEYIETVPDGGYGHNAYFIDQVTDLNGVDGIDGEDACGLATAIGIIASLKGTANISVDDIYQGTVNAGAYSNSEGILDTNNLVDYMTQQGLQEKTILQKHGSADDSVIEQVKAALRNHDIIMVHTSKNVSFTQDNPTDGHYFYLYAYKGDNFYFVNVGARADSPPGGLPIPKSEVQAMLDGFYAFNTSTP